MSCKPVCRLCDHNVISRSVTFEGGNLVINLPAGTYANGEKYCIIIADAIPAATTINAPVVMTIGDGTEQYALHRGGLHQRHRRHVPTAGPHVSLSVQPAGGDRRHSAGGASSSRRSEEGLI